jgi:hypothetical protein
MNIKKTLFLSGWVLLLSSFAMAGQRKVLVEMFTNSHCVLCPPAHNALKAYASTSPNAGNIRYIYYHNRYPYPSDPLFQANPGDADGRANYYFGGALLATPRTLIDGKDQGSSASSTALDARVIVESPLDLTLTGSRNGNVITLNASVQATGNLPGSGLVIHFVVVENSTYVGNNGVSPQNYVMRSMKSSPTGEPFSITSGQIKNVSKSITLSSTWVPESVGVVVFVQNSTSREIYQSDYIAVRSLVTTGVENNPTRPKEFTLEQNYPNPFNPTTTIEFSVATSGHTSLRVFDMLGREVAVLVHGERTPGVYTLTWDASALPSGVYLARMQAGSFVATRKMTLVR